MFTFETDMAETGWKTVLSQIIEYGDTIEDETGLISKELLNVVVTVGDPESSKPPEGYFSSGEKLKKCQKQFLNIENYVNGYNYGERLREHFGFKLGRNIYGVKTDQVELVVNRLKNSETTRKATLTVFDPSIDQYQNKIPRLIMIDFKIRKNRLFMTAVWRSHDIYGAWIPNFFGLKGLSKYISECLGIKIGPITIHSISAHIYKTNIKDVKKLINGLNR